MLNIESLISRSCSLKFTQKIQYCISDMAWDTQKACPMLLLTASIFECLQPCTSSTQFIAKIGLHVHVVLKVAIYMYLMLVVYKESKKLSQIVHKSIEILLFCEYWSLYSTGQFWTIERCWTGRFRPVQKGWSLPPSPKLANPGAWEHMCMGIFFASVHSTKPLH